MPLTIAHDTLLGERTTLRLGGPALAEAVVSCEAGLDELARLLPGLGGCPLALGAGSNILAADGPHALVLVRAANNAPAQYFAQQGDSTGKTVLVRAGAGLRLPRLLGLCQRAGLSGLEGLTGVPGRIGGSLAMNAGSYGVELCALLTRVRLWTPEGGLVWREARDCAFGYRHFDPRPASGVGAGFWLIWEAEFALRADSPGAVRARMEATYAKKKASQPVTARSAGCVFKNPAGTSAGRLLDEAGLKGRRLGGMAFSTVHANFLVNEGKGTAAEALELLEYGRAMVFDRFSLNLETEVKVLS
jgi:UDP-N-acetylmuramate dehydrogenase